MADYGVTPATAALTVSATTFGVALSVLPWSLLADRFGRVPVMKASIVIAGVIGLAAPFAPSFELFVGVRFVLGIALGALPAVSMAYLAEEIADGHVTRAASTFVAGNSIGGLVGRVLAGALGQAFGWHVGLGAVAVLTLASGIAFVLLVPPPRGFVPTAVPLWRLGVILLGHLRNPRLRALYVQGLLVVGTVAAMYNYVGFRLQAPPLDVPPVVTSYLFVVFAFGAVATAVAGRLATLLGRRPLIYAGQALLVLGAALTLADDVAVVIAGLSIFTIGTFAGHALSSGLVGQLADGARAQATALYQLLYQAGSAALGWLVGVVFDLAGWPGVVGAMVLCAGAGAVALRRLGRV